jgi:hypothetical protein
MSEPDQLAQRLTALRVAAIEATRPPGVATVRRTVARRDARRTVVGAFMLLVLAVAVVLAGATGRNPSPVLPPTLNPTPSPTATPSTMESTTTSPAAAASPASTSTSGLRCGYVLGGADILGSDPITVGPPDYWSRCPSSRLRILAAMYYWDVASQHYTQAHVTTIYLTLANQTAPMPTPQVDSIAGACGYLFVVIGTNVDLPTALPITPAGNWDPSYWYNNGYGQALEQQWNMGPNYLQAAVCRPATTATS